MSLLLLFQSGPTTVTGTLTKTLGAKTLSATATVAVSASLAKTLGAKTLSATATVTTPGSGSQYWRHRRRRHVR